MYMNKRSKRKIMEVWNIIIPFIVPERFEKVKKDIFGFIVLNNK